MTIRIAMWSGPRNLSTAMMRAFENRPDCVVSDEPFYAAYLAATGLDHPMRAEVLVSQPTDWHDVAAELAGPVPPAADGEGAAVWYQKHMSQHMLPGDDLSWSDRMVHCFLIREPEEMVASYAAKREDAVAADFGFERQWELFEHVRDRIGCIPPVLDAADVLRDPRRALTALCQAIGIPFDPAMLSWPAGQRKSDGIWAAVWYQAVERSTGFRPYDKKEIVLPPRLQAVASSCRPAYDRMAEHRLLKEEMGCVSP